MNAPPRPLSLRDPGEYPALDGLSSLLARLYAARGVRSPGELDYRLQHMLPVGSLPGVDTAVDLLLQNRQQRIVIVGDFDADGATSTALVMRCLAKFGFRDVDYLVPNRFDFGYGLTPEIVAVAAESHPALIVTVDNGISSREGVETARQHGIDVLVTDHHLAPETLPDAACIVNPNLPDSEFGSRNLAGVGVAFYVMAALGRRLAEGGLDGAAAVPAGCLDLVALGTVADVVPLDYNNRILVQQGIERIRAGRCAPGILALVSIAGRDPMQLVSNDLAFAAGPRLNAAGRLEDMSLGIECLLTDDPAAAGRLAATLDEINRSRREIEATMREQAFEAVDTLQGDQMPECVALFDPRWHSGVVGLIAARVRERWHRPTLAFAKEKNGDLKGSGRSVPGVHLRDLLEAVASRHPGLIPRFGGHAMAAGLSLRQSDFEDFREALVAAMRERYPSADLSGAILSDGCLPGDAYNLRTAEMLREAGPWGSAFPEPLFHAEFDVLQHRVVGERHLKMKVRPQQSETVIDAIAFNQQADGLCSRARLAFRLDVNEYRGLRSAQLVVEQVDPV